MATLDELLAQVKQYEEMFAQEIVKIDGLGGAQTAALLATLKNTYTSRKAGVMAGLMNRLAELPAADKREFGKQVNAFKARVENVLAEREAALAATRRPAGAVDVTLPGRSPLLGYRHPLSIVRDEVIGIFSRLGYQVLEGPEVEDDYHNFEALNMPADHPARDMQDTLYLKQPLVPVNLRPSDSGKLPGNLRPSPDSQLRAGTEVEEMYLKQPLVPGVVHGAADPANLRPSLQVADVRGTEVAPGSRRPRDGGRPLNLLRTHTSAMQIRHMEQNLPPVRLISIGPVYRRDNLDLTHTPMFHQCEGLVVGRHITLADLKGTLTSMATALFGEGQELRFRPSFFPYTEPSAEVDIRCIRCQGAGCNICKRTGWLEILGSGMVHPAVFEAVGYDPDEVTGFAFGMGLERVALLKWDVEDIRLFYENDMRFLEQFGL